MAMLGTTSLGRARRMPVLGGHSRRSVSSVLIATLTPGSFTFVAPRSGYYLFEGLGGGASGNSLNSDPNQRSAGGDGSVGRIVKPLWAGQSVAITVGAGGTPSAANNGVAGGATSFTFPDGTTMSCGGGTAGTTASPGNGGAVTGAQTSASGTSGTNGAANVGGQAATLLGFSPQTGCGVGSAGVPSGNSLAGGPGFARVQQG